jgi:hypothetical protein
MNGTHRQRQRQQGERIGDWELYNSEIGRAIRKSPTGLFLGK